jgi:signal transduction histidine kinase
VSARYRFGIRAKLLAFGAAALLAVAGIVLTVQLSGRAASREYENRLSRYHAVHRLRTAIGRHFENFERTLRENAEPDANEADQALSGFWYQFADVEAFPPESLDAYFNVRATKFGIEAYGLCVARAYSARRAGQPDWYAQVVQAGKIAAYVDGYLTDLLSAALDSGAAAYKLTVERADLARRLVWIAALGLALAYIGLAAGFAAALTAPIRRLAAAAERMAAGELSGPEIRCRTRDEIATLTDAFNQMRRSIRSMVDDLRDKAELEARLRADDARLHAAERELRDARFANLQDQIRPHFLFNALNTIARTALFEKAGDTERLTLALARLLRYSLGPTDALVPLREEAEIVREYLAFQQIRFGERLSWSLEISAAAGSALIPRFTLQPLVENAVRHGVEPAVAGGRVAVAARRRGGKLLLTVSDSGVGMAPEAARALERGTAAERGAGGGEAGIGLANVRRRLELRYGEAGGFRIRSAPGAGTEIRLSLPEGPAGPDAADAEASP